MSNILGWYLAKGGIFVVFQDSYEAWDYFDAYESECFGIACWNGYENAVCVQILLGA